MAARLELVHQVQVGMAGAGAADPDHHLTRPGRRIGDLDQLGFRLPLLQPQRAHPVLPSVLTLG